jgi:hypothetical protein
MIFFNKLQVKVLFCKLCACMNVLNDLRFTLEGVY